jgi:hypothetical protein
MKEKFVLILFLSLFGCKSLYPSHIQVFTGTPPDKQYRVLGPVEAEWREHMWTKPGVSSGTRDSWNPMIFYDEVNLALQQVAYTLFGDNVDAIINVKYRVWAEYRGLYRRGVCKVRGVAIQYLSSPQTSFSHYVTYMYGPKASRTVTVGQP